MHIRMVAFGGLLAMWACAGDTAPATEPASPRGTTAEAGSTSTYETVLLSLPRGSAEAGRRAFLDLRCVACHTVSGERDLPAPISANPGPDLGTGLAAQPPGAVATSIVAPSHAMSMRTGAEVRDQIDGARSPMGDYSESMTVRQLLDLLAYLEAPGR